jgi:hypothetical protein
MQHKHINAYLMLPAVDICCALTDELNFGSLDPRIFFLKSAADFHPLKKTSGTINLKFFVPVFVRVQV